MEGIILPQEEHLDWGSGPGSLPGEALPGRGHSGTAQELREVSKSKADHVGPKLYTA